MDPSKYRPRDAFNPPFTTTLAGAPVSDTTNSLTAGARGPVLLNDFHLLEKLANFDRERIPERVVHARGVAARGVFTCTRAMGDVCAANLLKQVGMETPVTVRFSTVVHSRHSPEALRDPRGFAVKFYSQQGNWDLVGNNMPVFFIRDAMAFPDMVHAFKPNPRTEKQEWSRIYDLLSFHPECMHMLTFLLDDVGIPRAYQNMPGFGVHTFELVNAAGARTLVKFHWVPEQEVESIAHHEDAVRIGGEDFSHATHALVDAIDSGDFPAWRLCVQLMDPEAQTSHSWGDPLDPTKTWPEQEYPLIEVGRMVLNKNVDNQFLESEQVAFSPAVVPPGITYSADKLLQGRLFSYADTQRYRLGANYQQLPINAPRCPFANMHYDGAMNPMVRVSETNYFPSSKNGAPRHAMKVPVPGASARRDQTSGVPTEAATRETIPVQNNFGQAGERFRGFDPERKSRFVGRVAESLNEPGMSKQLRSTWIGYWAQCDRELGARLAQKVNMSNM